MENKRIRIGSAYSTTRFLYAASRTLFHPQKICNIGRIQRTIRYAETESSGVIWGQLGTVRGLDQIDREQASVSATTISSVEELNVMFEPMVYNPRCLGLHHNSFDTYWTENHSVSV